MKTNSFPITAGAMALAAAAWVASVSLQAQPLYDKIQVNLPYTITLQNKTLQPGDYTIRQLPSTGGSGRVLLFYTNDGMKFETSAMTIPAVDPNTARDTKVILNHLGEDYYISKIWIQGKDYGYELPVPDSLKSRQNERMTESSVTGTYQPASSAEVTESDTTSTPAPTETAQTTQPTTQPATEPASEPAAQPTEPAAQPTEPAAQPTEPAPQSAATDNNSADRAMPDQDAASANSSANRDTMPSTAADWLTMLWAGGALSGAGLMLRRKRQ